MDNATRDKILAILGGATEMTIATVRPDGFPQATTVSYVHDGFTLYFGTPAHSQKARNIGLSDKVSLTVNLPYDRTEEILGLSMGAHAARVTDTSEIARCRRTHACALSGRRGFRARRGRHDRHFFGEAGGHLGARLPTRHRPH